MSNSRSSPAEETPANVPEQVFEDFLATLKEAKISDDVIARLRQTLLAEKKFGDASIKIAVLGDGA